MENPVNGHEHQSVPTEGWTRGSGGGSTSQVRLSTPQAGDSASQVGGGSAQVRGGTAEAGAISHESSSNGASEGPAVPEEVGTAAQTRRDEQIEIEQLRRRV